MTISMNERLVSIKRIYHLSKLNSLFISVFIETRATGFNQR